MDGGKEGEMEGEKRLAEGQTDRQRNRQERGDRWDKDRFIRGESHAMVETETDTSGVQTHRLRDINKKRDRYRHTRGRETQKEI